jgi:hypothetical protein
MIDIVVAGADRLGDVEPLTRSLHEHHRTVDPAIPGVPPRDVDTGGRSVAGGTRRGSASPGASC